MSVLNFCLLHADYITEGEGSSEKPVIRLWGRTNDEKTVVVLDKSFVPYFYVSYDASLSKADLTLLKNRIINLEIEGKKPVSIEGTERKYLGKPVKLLKVFVSLPMDVPKFRDLLKDWREVEEEYEYSISYYKRYMIDKGLIPMDCVKVTGKELKSKDIKADIVIKADSVEYLKCGDCKGMKILAFDLETMRDNGKDKIIMASFKDNRGFKKVIAAAKKRTAGIEPVVSEDRLIKRFVEIIKNNDPDIIAGYNTDQFDFAKLADAADKYRIDMNLGRDNSNIVFSRRGYSSAAKISGRVHIDLYSFIRRILGSSLSTEVLSLDNVAQELVGQGKIQVEWSDVEKAWKKRDLSVIGRYCLRDSEITLKLAENLLPQIFEISNVSGQLPFDCSRMSYSQLVEWLLIRKAYHIGEIVPNMPKYDEMQRRRKAAPYIGGYVHQPTEGIHENIALFDFQSLYPSITITHNISPETVDCKDCKASELNQVPDSDHEHHFCAKQKGFVPTVIEYLVSKRNDIKHEMKKLGPRSLEYKAMSNRQYALKIIANASYGYYGYPGSRWYSRICAESITAWGRHYIKDVIATAESAGYEVIYGDTDSLFVKIKTKKDAKEFLKKVNSKLPGIMELDFSGFYTAGIFVTAKTGLAAKKRYALINKEGELTIRGFERVRRDWSDIAKDTQERILKAILKDRNPEKAVQIARRIIENIRKGKIEINDLIIYTQLTKPVEEYEQVGPHVVAAKKMIKAGIPVREGTTIAYIITKGPGSISERAEPAEVAKAKNDFDPDYYINNQVIPAAMRVLSGLGFKEEDLLSKKRLEQVSLSDFVRK